MMSPEPRSTPRTLSEMVDSAVESFARGQGFPDDFDDQLDRLIEIAFAPPSAEPVDEEPLERASPPLPPLVVQPKTPSGEPTAHMGLEDLSASLNHNRDTVFTDEAFTDEAEELHPAAEEQEISTTAASPPPLITGPELGRDEPPDWSVPELYAPPPPVSASAPSRVEALDPISNPEQSSPPSQIAVAQPAPSSSDRRNPVSRCVTLWREHIGPVGTTVAVVLAVVVIVFQTVFHKSSDVEGPSADTGPIVLNTPQPSKEKSDEHALTPEKLTPFCDAGSTDPNDAFRGDERGAWICVRSHRIDNNGVTVRFHGIVTITKLFLLCGWNHVTPNGKDQWLDYRLVDHVTFTSPGTQSRPWSIAPTRDGATYTFDPPITTAELMIVVDGTVAPQQKSAIPGQADDVDKAFAVGRLIIYGRNPK